MEQITNTLLTRKQRNNGVGRAYLADLMCAGTSRFMLTDSPYGSGLGFSTWKIRGIKNSYEYFLHGEPDEQLKRLNRPNTASRAAEFTRLTREQRRYLRSLGVYESKPQAQPAIAGANGRLVRHFHKTQLTLAVIIPAMAHALRCSEDHVLGKLRASYEARGAATIRLESGFVFRVDFLAYDTSVSPLDSLKTVADLRTTKDNSAPVYRRLRNHLRRKLGCVSRAKQVQREEYKKGLKFMRTAHALLRVA